MKKIVFAGVGKPINDSDWRVSILNLARRNMEKKGMMRAEKGNQLMLSKLVHYRNSSVLIQQITPNMLLMLQSRLKIIVRMMNFSLIQIYPL